MYTEQTSNGKYAIQDLEKDELELLIEGLIVLKSEKFTDHEHFVHERRLCVQLYKSMNEEMSKG